MIFGLKKEKINNNNRSDEIVVIEAQSLKILEQKTCNGERTKESG